MQDLPNIDCIYDFIYLDSKRLTSFLAQLDDDGVLLSIKNTSGSTRENKNIGSAGLTMAMRAAKENTESVEHQSERHYDSSTAVLYSAIDRLDELGFIKRRADETAMGQLLLCSGMLTFQDIRMMRDLWEPIVKLLINGHQGNGKQKQDFIKEMDIMKSIILGLPHALLMTLNSEGSLLWSSLEEEHLKINSDDITLKHGANFAGRWHVLGILDAKPDEQSEHQILPVSSPFFHGMTTILENIRETLGRPSSHYGITPIAIFRTVSANS